jgi:site-specific DNA recombinase
VKSACAVYTRKSSEEGLEQGFNSLDSQREACEAFILSQKGQGWQALPGAYDDGGFSGGNMQRPALQRLLADVASGRVKIVVVYKVDRLTRSLADFAKLVELFDAHGVSFVSVTQQFNTTTSMGRLTLNVLLSFAQFEREVTGERIRDKIAASKRKGMWMGGIPPIGYRVHERALVIDEVQAERVREMYRLYLVLSCVRLLKARLDELGWVTPVRQTKRSDAMGERPFSRGHLYRILSNPVYAGRVSHKGRVFEGQHPALLDETLWQAVQLRLGENQQGQRVRSTAAQPGLLAGLVYDEHGVRMTSTHAQKGSRRYRYYVVDRPDGALRLPAVELERVVWSGIKEFLGDKGRVLSAAQGADAQVVKLALDRAQRFLEGERSVSQVQEVLSRVDVLPDRLEMQVRVPGLDQATAFTVPVARKRCGMAVRLIVRTQAAGKPDQKLIALVIKARSWFDRLKSGQADSVDALARDEGVTGSFVTRVLYVAFLAPDIVQQIAKGDHSPQLNADRLMRKVPLPAAWSEQRAALGLAPSASPT